MTNLTPAQLARYLGQTVQFTGMDNDLLSGTLVAVDVLNKSARVEHEGSTLQTKLHPENVRPVLRKLSGMSEVEVAECFFLSFPGYEPTNVEIIGTTIWVTRKADYNEVMTLRMDSEHMNFTAYIEPDSQSLDFQPVAVVDFLDSIGVDCRGYLAQGVAVEKTD